ncbi:MAG: carbohydrate-binding family 9-like protein [Polyangiaceae bacterium]|nr:carbohydrate-binding family 9-like protein [Polyangiaceae bacterium]
MSRLAALALLPLALAGCVERSRSSSNAARLALYILDEPPAQIPHPTPLVFGEKIRLLGYKLDPEGPLKPGQEVKLSLYWQCEGRLDGGWQLFTHLLDEQGNRLPGGHFDNAGPLRETSSGRQALPPSDWKQGKIYVDEQPLRIPDEAGPRVALAVGIWREDQRLPVAPPAPQHRPILTHFTVAAPRREPPSLRVPRRAEAPPVIDGKLDDPLWKSAPSTGPFVDVATGAPNRLFPVNGTAQIAWDDTHLYLAFSVLDSKLLGGLTPGQRDQRVWEQSCVEIMIDPDGDGDNRDYYELQISPQNEIFDSQFDGYNLPRGGPQGPFGHQDWDFRGATAVALRGTLDRDDDVDEGYTVEAAIAWSSFSKARRVPPADGDTWRINFYAMKRNGGVAWSPILGEGNFHKASRFGRVTFVAPPAPPASAPPRGSR